ncbi:MAG: HNH endonuclease [Gallionella sp.]|nr:HNH endonuclease [Gallionella sp.]
MELKSEKITQTQSSEARTIQRRHAFFVKKMFDELKPVLLDQTRIFGEVEREIVYYRDGKRCAVCKEVIRWPDLEIHHIEEHQIGGLTVTENAVSVHKDCHPKGQKAVDFKIQWLEEKLKEKEKREAANIDADELLREIDEYP